MTFARIKMPSLLMIALICGIVSACSGLRFPGVYKVNVQQGNYLQQSKLDELKKGMTPIQVQYILGTPLVKDPFNQDRWDYFFSVKRGDTVFEKKSFTVLFEDGVVSGWEGDLRPRTEEELAELEAKIKAYQESRQVDENVLTDRNIEATNREKGKPKAAKDNDAPDASTDTTKKNAPQDKAKNAKSDEEVEETVQEAPFLEEAPGEHSDFDPSEEP